MKFANVAQLAGVMVSALIASVEGHSWIDTLQVVGGTNPISTTPQKIVPGDNPKTGFIRGYPDFRLDTVLTNRIMFAKGAPACMDTQKTRSQQNPNKPRLKAAPGAMVQGNYTENGHISLPNSDKQNPGTIYWYGTKNPQDNETFSNVIKWTEDGTGGDGRGKLLAKPSSFDDGVCVEANGSPIALARKDAGKGGTCKSVFKVPEDLKAGDTYTVYWFWDFSEHFGPLPSPTAPLEWYTSCMDIDIVSPSTERKSKRGVSRIMRYHPV